MADNVSMTFTAQDEGVKKQLDEMAKANQNMEASAKAASVSLKEQAKHEAAMAQLLVKTEQAANRLNAAEERRAERLRASSAASLQAQKSAALLADMRAKAAREERMATGWERVAADAQMRADASNHERAMKRKREMLDALTTERTGMFANIGAAGKMAAAYIGLGSGAAAFAAALRLVIAEQENQMNLSSRSNEAAKGMKEFASLQAPGEEGKKQVQDVVKAGALAGLSPDQAAGIAGQVQSMVDANGDGKLDPAEKKKFDEDYGAALKLTEIGATAEDARTLITGGRARNIGGAMTADKATKAASLSKFSLGDFAKAAPAMQAFESADAALAATAGLSQEITPEQAPTMLRSAALALGSSADKDKFTKKFHLAGLSETEKIAALQRYGAQHGKGATEEERIANFSRTFKAEGLDEEKARALGILVRQNAKVQSTMGALSGVQGTGSVADEKLASLTSDPIVGAAMAAQKAKAVSDYNAMYGPEAQDARDKRAALQTRGAELQGAGLSVGVDESGNAKPWYSPSRIAAEFIARTTGADMAARKADAATPQSDRNVAAMERLANSLDKNTEATEANSKTTTKQAPVGGNPMNAEEKY